MKAKLNERIAKLSTAEAAGTQSAANVADEVQKLETEYGQLDKVVDWMKGWGERLKAEGDRVAKEAAESAS